MSWKVEKVKDASYMKFRVMDEKEMKGVALAIDGKEAHLISAAPELLECLNAVMINWRQLNDDHFSGPSEKLRNICRQAIAKAEGKE